MGVGRQLSIEQARALVDDWEAQREDYEWQARLAARFGDANPRDVIKMWETGRNEKGKPLSKFEVQALAERWGTIFGTPPPCNDDQSASEAAGARSSSIPMPADDTMLGIEDVQRMTGLSKSTIKRKVLDGSFPTPVYPSVRRKAWPARVVKAWLEQLGAGGR